jgi:DNA-binding response OmpR family regulator
VFEYLAAHSDRFVTAEELQHEVLGTHGDGSAIRYHVSQLRRRLGCRAVIETRPKFGYRLDDASVSRAGVGGG